MDGKNISTHSATVADTQVVNTEYFQSALYVSPNGAYQGLEVTIVQDILETLILRSCYFKS